MNNGCTTLKVIVQVLTHGDKTFLQGQEISADQFTEEQLEWLISSGSAHWVDSRPVTIDEETQQPVNKTGPKARK